MRDPVGFAHFLRNITGRAAIWSAAAPCRRLSSKKWRSRMGVSAIAAFP